MWFLLAGFMLVCAADATPAGGRTVPGFGKVYRVKGELSLPLSWMKELFEVRYDLEGNRTRIDYGTVHTFLNGNDLDCILYIYTIMPVITDDKIHRVIKGFQLNGTKEDPIPLSISKMSGSLVSFLQAMGCTLLKFEKTENHTGVQCEMEGYNTLLESHYDKYTITYSDFSPQTESDIFIRPEEIYGEFPDPVEERQILANPIQDYVSTSPVSHAHRLFGPFKKKFDRQYESEKEHEERENYFVHTQRYVHSTNRAGLSFSVGINNFVDKSKAELDQMTGGLLIPDKERDVTK